jgi:hypothetical protein
MKPDDAVIIASAFTDDVGTFSFDSSPPIVL